MFYGKLVARQINAYALPGINSKILDANFMCCMQHGIQFNGIINCHLCTLDR